MLNGCLQLNHRKYFTILTSDIHIYKQGTVNRILLEFWVSISWNSCKIVIFKKNLPSAVLTKCLTSLQVCRKPTTKSPPPSLRWLKQNVHEGVSRVVQTKVMRVRAWLTCHTFSSSYSSKASWNWAGVKPRETQRCSASAMRTNPPAPRPSAASSRTREKMTSAGRCVLQMRKQIFKKKKKKKVNFKASRNFE